VIRIERATSSSSDAIAHVMRETWDDTYGAYFTTDTLLTARRLWLDALPPESALQDPSITFLLAWNDASVLVGFIAVRALRSGDAYVLRLYVRPSDQRCGVGAALLGAAIAEVPLAPVIRLDVEVGNKKAVAFWDKNEFRESGRRKETVAGVEISLIEMEKHLA
jgi:ribosomal protein S18 acetylase RimI-like enzyme